MPRKRSESMLTHWKLRGLPVAKVIKEIEKLQPHLQPWAGRIVWWDRFSEGVGGDADPDPWRKWLERRDDVDVPPDELKDALVKVGYTPTYAGLRSGAKLWNTGRQKGKPVVTHKPPPDGIIFPLDFGYGVRMYRISNGKNSIIYQMYLVGQKERRRRNGSTNYWQVLEACVIETRNRSRGTERVPALKKTANTENTKHEN